MNGELVLTSEDGVLAGLAVDEAQALTERRSRYLRGGNAAWRAAGHPLSTEARMADEPLDYWPKPYERAGRHQERDERVSVLGGRSAAPHRARRHDAVHELTLASLSPKTGVHF